MIGTDNFLCPNCNKLNELGSKTCWNCGKDFTESEHKNSKIFIALYLLYFVGLILIAEKIKNISEIIGYLCVIVLHIAISIYKNLKNDAEKYKMNKDIIKLGYLYIEKIAIKILSVSFVVLLWFICID